MTYLRLAYDDAAPTAEMSTDCLEVGKALTFPAQATRSMEVIAASFFDDYVSHAHPLMDVTEATAHLADGLEQHLD